MKLILPLNLANKLIDNLKYDQVDSYYVSPSFSEPTLEDFVFANLVLDHLKENSESI